jgi:hypothetical protein
MPSDDQYNSQLDRDRKEAARRALEGEKSLTEQERWGQSLAGEPGRNLRNIGGDIAGALLPDMETLQGAGVAMAGAPLGLGGPGALLPWLDLDFYSRAKWDAALRDFVGDANPRTLWEHTPQQINQRSTTELVPIEDLWRAREYTRPSERWKPIQESIEEHGLREPLMLEYNPKTQRVYLGEGNHRLAAMRESGNTYAPARVVRSSGAPSQGYSSSRPGFLGVPVQGPPPDQFGYVPGDLKPSQIGLPSRGLGDVVRTVQEQRPDLVSEEILKAYKLYGGVPADPELLRGAASAAGALIPGPVEAAGLTVPIAAAGQYERTQDPYEQLRHLSLHMKRDTLEKKDLAPTTLGLLLQDRELANRLADDGLISSDLYQHLERKRAEHNY